MRADSNRALIVDADAQTRDFCRGVLEKLGFSVRDTDSGVAAVVAARETVPDVILLGQQLRDVAGREFLDWLDSNPALGATPVLALNGWVSKDAAAERRERPTIALPQTLSAANLRRGIETALKRKSNANQNEGRSS
jgi:CheY-like chemotaxis protein